MKKWPLYATAALAVVLGAALLLDPSSRLLGLLRHESFFRGKPARYWAKAFDDPDPLLQQSLPATFRAGGEAAIPVLVEVLRDERAASPQARWLAAARLGDMGAQASGAVPALVAALGDRDPHVRAVAAEALGNIGPPAAAAVPALVLMLKGDEALSAARALGSFGEEAAPAVPALTALLKDADGEVRWTAAATLGDIGPAARPALPALIAALKDENPAVREHAAETLGQIGPPAAAAVAPLTALLADGDGRVRRDAARALGQIGPPAARPAIKDLKRLLQDRYAPAASAAARSLRQLDTAARDGGKR